MPHLLTPQQAADRLNLSKQTLANWRSLGDRRLSYLKDGRIIRYPLREIERYEREHEVA